jgi:predicted nuclease of predicted toxin-antitoxin system
LRFKLDENLSPSLASVFAAAGHDAMTAIQQALGGQPDWTVLDVCESEQRALVTHDLDVANIWLYPPSERAGIVVFRLRSQAHESAVSAVRRMLEHLQREPLAGTLWIVEDERIRIHA